MDLRHLRHFIAVAEEGHFGRAAARLGIEQSPLSRSIRHLEGQLHCPLLHRSPKGSVLTAMGAALLPEARALLAHAARLKTHVIDVEAMVTRVLRLGVSDAVATPRLTECLSTLRRQFPDLLIEIVPLGAGSAMAALEQGAIDAGIAVDPGPGCAFRRVRYWTERFAVAMTHPVAVPGPAPLPASDLLAAPEVLVTEAWAVAAEHWLQALADRVDGHPPPIRTVGSWLGLLATVAVGPGIALVPAGLRGTVGHPGVTTRAVAGRNPRVPVVLMSRHGHEHPRLEDLKAVLRQRPWLTRTTVASAPADTPDRSP